MVLRPHTMLVLRVLSASAEKSPLAPYKVNASGVFHVLEAASALQR